MSTSRRISRRAVLVALGGTTSTAFLAVACGPTLPTAVPTKPPTAAAPAATAPAATSAAAPAATVAPAKPTAPPKPAETPAAPVATVPRNKTLIWGFEGGPVSNFDNMNPNLPTSRNSFGLHQVVIESLWYLNYEDGKMIPWLAESYAYNNDFTQATINLRKGAKWSDGQPFTSKDVVFTLNMLKDAGPKLSYGPMAAKWIKEVRATNDQTVQIDLTEPYARFILENFAVHIWGAVRILPEHIWKGQDPVTFNNFDLDKGWPVFTGPYKLVKASEGEFIFDRDSNWWGKATGFHDLPAPERIVFVDQGPQDRRVALLQNNDVDGLPQINAGPFETAHARNSAVIGWQDQKNWSWIDPCPLRMLTNCAKEPWSDPEIRWALNWALDKQKYIEINSEGLLGKEAMSNFIFPHYPPLLQMLDKNKDLFDKYPVQEYNLPKAKEVLSKKGYKPGADGILVGPDGNRFEATMVVTTPAEGGSIVGPNFIAEQYQQLGLQVNIKQLSGAARTEAVLMGDYDLLPYHNCGGVVDPYATLDNYHARFFTDIGSRMSGGAQANTPRWHGAKNDEFSKLTDQIGLLAPADPKIDPLFRQALEIWLQELPNFPLGQQFRIVPYNSTYWTNFPTAKNDYIHPPNWWMTTLQIVMNLKIKS